MRSASCSRRRVRSFPPLGPLLDPLPSRIGSAGGSPLLGHGPSLEHAPWLPANPQVPSEAHAHSDPPWRLGGLGSDWRAALPFPAETGEPACLKSVAFSES